MSLEQYTETELVLPENLPKDQWIAVGVRLRLDQKSIQWWIGDWINYGEKVYGETYKLAASATGYEESSLQTMASVSKRVEPLLRNKDLSWNHHKEVASLDTPEQQRYWLNCAAQKPPLSVRELRDMIHQKPEAPRSEEIWRLREWIKQNCPSVQAYVQNSTYDVVERLKTGDVDKFDLEIRLVSADDVKVICARLAQQGFPIEA